MRRVQEKYSEPLNLLLVSVRDLRIFLSKVYFRNPVWTYLRRETWVAAQTWERQGAQHFREVPTLSPGRNFLSLVVSSNNIYRAQNSIRRYYLTEISLKTVF